MQFSTTVLTAIFKPWLPKPEPDDFEDEDREEDYETYFCGGDPDQGYLDY